MTPLSKWAIAIALLGGIVLALTYLPALRPYFGRRTSEAPGAREATSSVEPTQVVATPTPSPAPPTFGLPVRLRIDQLGIDAPVIRVGVDSEGVMESPEAATDAGWYELGTKPGEQGSAVVAGHSGYRDKRAAIFDDLEKLSAGDEVVVVDEAGTSIRFLVRESRLFDPAADADEVFNRADGRFLNLVTCTGDWNASAGTHSQRLIVFCDAVE